MVHLNLLIIVLILRKLMSLLMILSNMVVLTGCFLAVLALTYELGLVRTDIQKMVYSILVLVTGFTLSILLLWSLM